MARGHLAGMAADHRADRRGRSADPDHDARHGAGQPAGPGIPGLQENMPAGMPDLNELAARS